jgi:hypothetical protein
MEVQDREKTFDDEIVRLNQKSRKQQIAEQEKAEEDAKKNHDFVQFTRNGLLKLSRLKNGLAVNIFLYLAKEMDFEAKIIISQETMAEIFEVSRMSISTAIKELVKNELVQIIKTGNASIYCLNAYVVWNTYKTNLELAKFKAVVVVSKKEQAKIKTTRMKQLSLLEKEKKTN